MKRFLLITLLLISIVPCLNAQKKELAQARTLIKSGKELDKAINMMDKLLRDSLNRRNMQVWQVRAEAIRAQYEQGNERLYLKQKQDTAELFLLARKMFLAYQQADSIDALPDRKGNVLRKPIIWCRLTLKVTRTLSLKSMPKSRTGTFPQRHTLLLSQDTSLTTRRCR